MTPYLVPKQQSGTGQGSLEIVTSRGGLLTLHAHPTFSSRTFFAPSASLIVRAQHLRSALELRVSCRGRAVGIS